MASGVKGIGFQLFWAQTCSAKCSHQRGNVLFPFPQRRQHEREYVNPVKEVLPELTIAHQGFQIAVRRHHDSHVHLGRLVGADAFDFAFLQHPQQLGLHGQGHVPDFVEEYRSPFGLFELANVTPGGASERTLLVTKKFGLDQFSRNCGTVQGDEWT